MGRGGPGSRGGAGACLERACGSRNRTGWPIRRPLRRCAGPDSIPPGNGSTRDEVDMGRPRAGPAGGWTRWCLGFGPPPRVALLRPAVLWMTPVFLSEVSLSRVGGRGQDLAAASEGHQDGETEACSREVMFEQTQLPRGSKPEFCRYSGYKSPSPVQLQPPSPWLRQRPLILDLPLLSGAGHVGGHGLHLPKMRVWLYRGASRRDQECREWLGPLHSPHGPEPAAVRASRFPPSPPGHRPTTAGTPRAGGRESSTPGTGTAPGSPAPASPRGGPPAGTKASPRWKGSSSSWSTASSPRPPSPTWAWAPGASCIQTQWTTPGGPTAWMRSSRSSSISLKTRVPHPQTKRKSRPSPPSP
ncbi:E3 ubiquitin-protein ligase RNF126 isoform X2 [Pseudorca crassidens]|uniref:E3 ubiquitin-protein ligase RNF126 isoform X2 n=1 Tax=Pseudorca crassidens TaxID=82174 RepID=UPI00352D80CF